MKTMRKSDVKAIIGWRGEMLEMYLNAISI